MSSQSVATAPVTGIVEEVWDDALRDFVNISNPDTNQECHRDALAGESAREIDCTRDETRWDALARERQDESEAVHRRRLDNPKSARGAYHDYAVMDRLLPHAQFRVLCYHLKHADPDLRNSFPSRATAAAALGMGLATYDTHMAGMRRAGYVRSHEFRRDNGKQAKGTGIQFCLPGRLFSSGEPWRGPQVWDKRRDGAVPKRARRNARSVREPVPNGSRVWSRTDSRIRHERISS